jgi:hypothetical protein
MKTFVKLGLIGLALAASTANADVALPGSGNGELTLFVRNDTTGVVYARGLQITLDGILTQTAINEPYTGDVVAGDVQRLNYALSTISADGTLSTFLNGTDTFSWTIMAGDSSGSGNNPSPDARRYLTTTQTQYGNPETDPSALINLVTNNNLVTFSNLQTMLTLVNNNIAGSTVGDGASTAVGGQWRQTGAIPGNISGNWFGAGPNTINALGDAAHLYILTSAGGGIGGQVRTYQAFDVVLGTDGILSAIVPAVPLPPAIWMLVSGLVTLAGVGRRNSAQAAA